MMIRLQHTDAGGAADRSGRKSTPAAARGACGPGDTVQGAAFG